MPLPNTSPDMSPTPTTVKSWLCVSMSMSRKCRLHRLPRASGGDAHAPCGRSPPSRRRRRRRPSRSRTRWRSRWRCRRTSRCPCRPRRPGRGRHRRGAPRRSAARPSPPTRLSVMSSMRRDEQLVAGDALRLVRVPVGGRRRLLEHEAALGPDRHDHGVLHHLCLDQPEHLGAEVVAAVRPAEPAACHRAEPQVYALEPRRVDEDLVLRPGRRQVRDRFRVELDRDVRARPTVGGPLEERRAQAWPGSGSGTSAGCGPGRGSRRRRVAARSRWPAPSTAVRGLRRRSCASARTGSRTAPRAARPCSGRR